jgi:hypothetical protein
MIVENGPLNVLNLATISGVIATSMGAVQLIKRVIPAGSKVAKVPIFVWTIMVAIILAVIANKLLKTSDGTPILEGNIWNVIWAAVTAAAGASGFFTWLYNPETVQSVKLDPANNDFGGKMTEKDKESLKLILLLPLLLLPFLSGCLPKGSPPAYQLYNANKTLVESNNLMADLANQKVIKDKAVMESYRELAKQSADAIDQAEAQLKPDGTLQLGKEYWYNQALSLVNRVIAFRLKYQSLKTQRSDLWVPSLSSPLSLPQSNDLRFWLKSRAA